MSSERRAPLARARGLGSAHHGTLAWWTMRVTSLALVPLSLWLVAVLLACVIGGNWQDAVQLLASPIAALLLLLFVGFSLHHAAAGLGEVIEDYVHQPLARLLLRLLVQGGCLVLALVGVLAILRVLLLGVP